MPRRRRAQRRTPRKDPQELPPFLAIVCPGQGWPCNLLGVGCCNKRVRLVIPYGAIAHNRAAVCTFRLRTATGSLINLYVIIAVVFNLKQNQVIGTNFGQPLNKLLTAYRVYPFATLAWPTHCSVAIA